MDLFCHRIIVVIEKPLQRLLSMRRDRIMDFSLNAIVKQVLFEAIPIHMSDGKDMINIITVLFHYWQDKILIQPCLINLCQPSLVVVDVVEFAELYGEKS